MQTSDAHGDPAAASRFVGLIGLRTWRSRLAEIEALATPGNRASRAATQRHAVELTIERLRKRARPGLPAAPVPAMTAVEGCVLRVAASVCALWKDLSPDSRDRLRARLHEGLTDANTLIPIFHLFRTAAMQRARGFGVTFPGLTGGAPFDLLLERDGVTCEVACDVISAEEGRGVHRGAWFRLVDRVDPELQTWLADHPGRYLLKMTLPQGLKPACPERDPLAALHQRITAMLSSQRRADHDEAAVLRLDPLLLAGAQADELGLMSRLRQEFGPEAHLSVIARGGAVFVLAARAGQENEVAVAVRRRLAAIAPARLTGARPGILAMFIEDTDRTEWRLLREKLELEGEARQFLTHPEARPVVAVTCTSRLELFGMSAPDAVADGELRFRNPAHPAAKAPALAPAVLSSM